MMRLRPTAVVHLTLFAAAVLWAALFPPEASARQAGAQTRPRVQEARPPAPRQGEGAQAPRAGVRDENADLSITARVTADSLRFEKVPNPRVEFTGRPARETSWEAERENLPRPVQPGVTYRNVGVTLRIVSVFADIDRIVAEALGEVPPTADAPPPPPAPAAEPPAAATAPPRAAKTPPANSAANARRRAPARRGRTN